MGLGEGAEVGGPGGWGEAGLGGADAGVAIWGGREGVSWVLLAGGKGGWDCGLGTVPPCEGWREVQLG